jgi:hypothetical protein
MLKNVGASTSHKPKGLHDLYRDNFTLPYLSKTSQQFHGSESAERSVISQFPKEIPKFHYRVHKSLALARVSYNASTTKNWITSGMTVKATFCVKS